MSFSFRQTYEQGLVNLLLSLKNTPTIPYTNWICMSEPTCAEDHRLVDILQASLSLQVVSPLFHPSSTQDSDAYGGSYSNRNVYQFASRFVFLRQRTWPAITYIYIYVYFSFSSFLNAYLRSTTVWTPHVNFSEKEVNAPGERFPAPQVTNSITWNDWCNLLNFHYQKSASPGDSWCCRLGNHCWSAIVLWWGYRSVSFQSFVLRHLVTKLGKTRNHRPLLKLPQASRNMRSDSGIRSSRDFA